MQFDYATSQTPHLKLNFSPILEHWCHPPPQILRGEEEGHAGPIIGEGAGGQFGWGFLFLGSRARSVIYESKNLFFSRTCCTNAAVYIKYWHKYY